MIYLNKILNKINLKNFFLKVLEFSDNFNDDKTYILLYYDKYVFKIVKKVQYQISKKEYDYSFISMNKELQEDKVKNHNIKLCKILTDDENNLLQLSDYKDKIYDYFNSYLGVFPNENIFLLYNALIININL